MNFFIKKLNMAWISVGVDSAIIQTPFFLGYRLLLFNGKLSLVKGENHA